MSSDLQQKPKVKTEFRQHVDFEYNTKYDTEELDNIIEHLESHENEIDITNYTDSKKFNKLYHDYIKKLNESKNENKEKMTINGKTIIKADKVGGSRINTSNSKTNIKKELEKEAKENKINVNELNKKLKETIKNLEEEVEKLEASEEFNTPLKILSQEEKDKYRKFLFSTYLINENGTSNFITDRGISTDKYISEMIDEKYSSQAQPKDSCIDSTPKQLIYISRLSKQLGTQLLKQSDTQLSFNNIDLLLCDYFKNNKIPDYKISYTILKEFFKKLIIVSLSDIELAFRSQNNWISNTFKRMILKDVVMLQSLPPKLAKSWKIFVEELCKTNDVRIFNDISKLDYVIHISEDFIIEETLAKSIKCMTPCFIYNYYNVIKSMYLMCGLIDKLFDDVKNDRIKSNDRKENDEKENNDENDEKENKKEKDEILYSYVTNIAKIPIYLYENTRLNENSTARRLPYSKEPISQELQMYYLNHTIIGPQYKLLKSMEKYILGLI